MVTSDGMMQIHMFIVQEPFVVLTLEASRTGPQED